MDSGWKSFEMHARNMNIKSNSGEVSDGSKKHVGNKKAKGAGMPCRAMGVTLPIQWVWKVGH